MLLGNITRVPEVAGHFLELQDNGRSLLYRVIDAFCVVRPPEALPKLHYLANVIFNVTQSPQGRRLLLLHSEQGEYLAMSPSLVPVGNRCVDCTILTFGGHGLPTPVGNQRFADGK